MRNYPTLSNQELLDKLTECKNLIERNKLINTAHNRRPIFANSQECVIMIPMKDGYEAERYKIFPEAYSALEPVYSQSVTENDEAQYTERLIDIHREGTLRKDKLLILGVK